MRILKNQLLAVGFFILVLSSSFVANAEVQRIALTPEEAAFVAAHPVIKVANEMDWPPFDYNEFDKPKGLSIDYIKLVAKKVGLQVEFVNGHTWDELLQLFKTKQLDVIPAIYRNAEREAFTLYTPPYYKGKLGIFTHADDVKTYNNADLLTKRVGIQKAHGAIPIIRAQVPGIQIIEYASTADLVKLLGTKKLDAIIGNPMLFDYLAKENQITDIQLVDYIDMSVEEQLKTSLHIGVRIDYPVLQQIFGKAMAAITDAEMAAIEGTWNRFQDQATSTIALTKRERAYLDHKDKITFCIDPAWMPYESINENGAHIGMSADYFDLFTKHLGVKFKLHPTATWNDSLNAVQKRKCDLITLVKQTEERRAYLDFTTAYLAFPYVVATRTETLFIEDIKQKLDDTFAVVGGYAVATELRTHYPQIKLLEVNNPLEGLKKVREGKALGYIGATAVIAYTLNQHEILDVKIAGQLPWGFELGVGSRNDEVLLGSIMQKAVDNIVADEAKRINDKWMAVNVKTIIDYTLIAQVIGVMAVIMIMVMFWSRKLAQAKRHTEEALLELASAKQQLEQQNRALEKLSITDSLTRLFNRAKLDEVLRSEVARAERYGHELGVVMLDLDHFKAVNDEYGHQVGDDVLVTVAELMKRHTRTNDIVGRWGGEEFLIICPETGRDGVMSLSEKLRMSIENQDFSIAGRKTSSFGVAMYEPGDSQVSIIAHADKALYNAKANGRNCVVIFLDDEG